jgi:hypothetical protein
MNLRFDRKEVIMHYPERDDFYETEENVCSNFDGLINKNVVQELIDNNCKAGYPAWEWYGIVWHQDNRFHIKVKRYGSVIGEHDYETMEELRDDVSEKYGDQ